MVNLHYIGEHAKIHLCFSSMGCEKIPVMIQSIVATLCRRWFIVLTFLFRKADSQDTFTVYTTQGHIIFVNNIKANSGICKFSNENKGYVKGVLIPASCP